jgi:hypothetical protein
MLTDDDVSEYNRSRPRRRRLRNLTLQQWRKIDAMLPRKPSWKVLFDLLRAINKCEKYAAGPSPKIHSRRVHKGAPQIRAALKTYRGAVQTEQVENICTLLSKAEAMADSYANATMTVSKLGANWYRHDFYAAALWFWRYCEGSLEFRRDVFRTPTGSVIHYLDYVCKIAMKDHPPAPETLAAFIAKWRRGR